MENKTRTIHVDYLARVEGEGEMFLKIVGGNVEEVKLKIFEPPRFFEAFLCGRLFDEVPDITARICGICPVAYQMSSIHAIEKALAIEVDPVVRDLRRLFYCGEWISSHTLHMLMLHAPDFFHLPDIIHLSKLFPHQVKEGLKIKKLGNDLMKLIGGRGIHPINAKVGGFYKYPQKRELTQLREQLETGIEVISELLIWFSSFHFPKFHRECEYVSLVHPDEYPMNEGRIQSSKGLNIPVEEFLLHFTEYQVPYSTALQSTHNQRGYYNVGPISRYNLNFFRLCTKAQEMAKRCGLDEICHNPFKGLLVRGIEVLNCLDDALRIINCYQQPYEKFPPSALTFDPQQSVGFAATEAPRGLLYHHYRIDQEGKITEAKIIPPTSQNQKMIEMDLLQLAQIHLQSSDEELKHLCEQMIRNHDPCISCSTHFLKMKVERQ